MGSPKLIWLFTALLLSLVLHVILLTTLGVMWSRERSSGAAHWRARAFGNCSPNPC